MKGANTPREGERNERGEEADQDTKSTRMLETSARDVKYVNTQEWNEFKIE